MATATERTKSGSKGAARKGGSFGIKVGIISLAAIITASACAFIILSNIVLSNENVYKGVMVEGKDVSGYTKDQLRGYLEQKYGAYAASESINLYYDDVTRNINITGKIYPDIEATTQEVFNVGKSGSFAKRLSDIIEVANSTRDLNINYVVDEQYIKDEVHEFAREFDRSNDIFTIDEEREVVIVDFNNQSKTIDIDDTANNLIDQTLHGDFSDLEATVTSVESVSAEDIFASVDVPAMDASLYVENNQVLYNIEKTGRTIDKGLLEQNLLSGEKYFELPIITLYPEVTVEYLKSRVFTDVLSTYSTNYNANQRERTTNVTLASEGINGVVLGPGDTFSFNKSVGPRTVERGYKEAIVFVQGKLEEGVGGGICQVSSTLYTAVLYANLQITSRAPHQFYVVYVPSGQDATVVYGAIDLLFVNNTGWPVRVESRTSGGTLTVTIIGTKTHPGRTIQIENTLISTRPYETRYEQSSSVAAGSQSVRQSGQEGRTVDTHKLIYDDGVLVDRVFLHRSVYSPMERIVVVNGATPSSGNEQQQQSEPPEPSNPPPEPTSQPSGNDTSNDTPANNTPANQEQEVPDNTPPPANTQPEPEPEQPQEEYIPEAEPNNTTQDTPAEHPPEVQNEPEPIDEFQEMTEVVFE